MTRNPLLKLGNYFSNKNLTPSYKKEQCYISKIYGIIWIKAGGDSMHIKPFEELTIQDNFMFQKVMRNKRICKATIERLLDIQIKDITYLEEEKSQKYLFRKS